MPKTGLNMGWSSVTITPDGGSAITITEITDVNFTRSASPKKFYGDANLFSKLIVSRELSRGCRISGGEIKLLADVPQGTPCTIVAVLDDAKNGAGAGAITSTLVNAVCLNNPYSGRANEFGTGSLDFDAFSTNGTTDPLTIVQSTGS